jgi:hypothetical protein
MKLDIYSKDGRLKLTVAPESSNAESLGIQEESTLSLSFTAFACVTLEVYDYAEFLGRRYWVTERYVPTMNARREWAYSVRLSGVEGLAAQTLMVNPDDGDNPVLILSAPAREHAALIVANLNRRMGTTDWKVGEVVVSEYIDIDYTGKYASDALSELSGTAGTEWWFDGMTLNISRCEFGEPIPLSYGNGLLGGISRTTADGVKFFTRLFPVGSSRNIDPDDYGHTRLQLPDGATYVEQDVHLGIVEHYEQAAFEGIYPRRVGQVGTVRHEEATGDDGEPFTIWYFTDPDIPFDPNQYEIGGLVKRVTFQSGELRGREFEVNYDADRKEFEIITQWPYDDAMQLPSEPLVPAPGDEYILWNIRMPENYYPAAEQEYRMAVDQFMADNRKDLSEFTASTDFTVIKRRGLDLRPGQRVRIESAGLFPDTGYRDTRIVSISRPLVRPGSMTLKMSDVLSTGRINRIESNIASVERLTKQVSSEFPDLIRSWEETPASDTTIYSSRKSEREFLNRRRGGAVEENVIFDKDVTVGGAIASKDFRRGDFSGAGFGLYRDENGNAVAEVDILRARRKAVFNTAVINQVTFQVGATVFSNGGCEIARVEDLGDIYRCYYDTKEGRRLCGLVVNDQVRCQRYDAAQHSVVTYYWRLVVAVGDDYVDLSKEDADGDGIPLEGDEIAQFGNRTDPARQRAIVINPLNGSVEVYALLDSYSLSEKNFVGMGADSRTGEAYLYAHGDVLFGDRDLSAADASWIAYRKQEGTDRRRLLIQGDVLFGPGSKGLSAMGEWKELADGVAALDYLKSVFPNNVVDNNGVFLSRLMAVKDSAEAAAAVVAGLYGGGVESLNNAGFKDPTHGILMMFAGAENIQSIDKAATRIYGDGALFTKSLYADGGKIGGFTVSDRDLVAKAPDGGTYQSELQLSYSTIRFLSSAEGTAAWLGVNSLPPSAFPNSICPLRIENSGSSDTRNRYGIHVSVSGGAKNVAIQVAKGSFVGFRPVSRVLTGTTTYTATNDDHFIVCNTTSGNVTVNLPSSPEPNQRIEIHKMYAVKTVVVNSSGGKYIQPTGEDTRRTQVTWTGRRTGTLTYIQSLGLWILSLSYQA